MKEFPRNSPSLLGIIARYWRLVLYRIGSLLVSVWWRMLSLIWLVSSWASQPLSLALPGQATVAGRTTRLALTGHNQQHTWNSYQVTHTREYWPSNGWHGLFNTEPRWRWRMWQNYVLVQGWGHGYWDLGLSSQLYHGRALPLHQYYIMVSYPYTDISLSTIALILYHGLITHTIISWSKKFNANAIMV